MKLLGAACLALLVVPGPARAAVGRLFASAQQCESAKALAPGTCRTAFANAMAEFSAKVPTYRSRRACFKEFGPCMPWPMGTHRFSQFRPQWIGITVGADMTASPAIAPGRIRFDFAPQSTAALSPAAAAGAAPAAAHEEGAAQATILTPDDDTTGDREAAPPRPGGGFTVIDGVLTYPAPARFQPKVLKHP